MLSTADLTPNGTYTTFGSYIQPYLWNGQVGAAVFYAAVNASVVATACNAMLAQGAPVFEANVALTGKNATNTNVNIFIHRIGGCSGTGSDFPAGVQAM